jgi:phage shock protein PspC (stress-responsive transcriptional regulator)
LIPDVQVLRPEHGVPMTETYADQAPPPPPPLLSAPPLLRPRHDRAFRGVAAALARSTGTDPVLWRVLFVVLAVFGGSGIVLYLAGWLLIPEEGAELSEAQRLVRGEGRGPVLTGLLVVAAVIATLVLLGSDGDGLVPLAVIGVVGYLVLRSRQDGVPASAGWSSPPSWTTAPPAAGTYGPVPPPAWEPSPPAPRRRSNLFALTMSAVAVVVGLLLLGSALDLLTVTAPVVFAAALLVTGSGLVVGAFWGRSRGLIVVAVVLGLALSATSSFDREFGSSSGGRTWVVEGPGEYDLGAGEATLDLRPLAGGGRAVDVEARLGLGELIVLVPADVDLDLDATIGIGQLRLTGPGGTDVAEGGAGISRSTLLEGDGGRRVQLDINVGAGEVEVRRVSAQ